MKTQMTIPTYSLSLVIITTIEKNNWINGKTWKNTKRNFGIQLTTLNIIYTLTPFSRILLYSGVII